MKYLVKNHKIGTKHFDNAFIYCQNETQKILLWKLVFVISVLIYHNHKIPYSMKVFCKIFVIAVPPTPPHFTKFIHENGVYELNWMPINNVDWEDKIKNYTIFSCSNDQEEPDHCTVSTIVFKTSISWF